MVTENFDLDGIIYPIEYTIEEARVDFRVREAEDSRYILLSGYIKWDGCSDWFLGEHNKDNNTHMMAHFCGREQFGDISKLLDRCWMICEENDRIWG
jgi:hypothetical protein